jgi:cytochrome c551/c552
VKCWDPALNSEVMKYIALAILLTTTAASFAADPASFLPVGNLLESHCLDCHDSKNRTGGFDLEAAIKKQDFQSAKSSEFWERVETAVRLGEMPPKDEMPLSDKQKQTVIKWFEARYIFADGKEQIGPTVLRRLTRYELINTLEDLLYISLKNPYVYSPEVPSLRPSVLETMLPPDVPGESGFLNDAHQQASEKPPILKYIDAFDYVLRGFSQDIKAREKLFGYKDGTQTLSDATAREILQRFMARAWRGYSDPQNEKAVLAAYTSHRKSEEPITALLHAMKICLLSPAFLYRLEASEQHADSYQVGAYELASRLSYFLWATMPDDELLRVAADKSLLKESVLLAQVERMLNSPKRISIAEDFAGQWLGFDELRTQKVFYQDERWNRGIYDELLYFFDELVKSDLSVLNIVDSDWVYQSEYTKVKVPGQPQTFPAKHGDIFEVRRQRPAGLLEQFYKPPTLIKVKSDERGGIITSVGIMRLTSPPENTNPIRRGVWLLDKIIGRQLHPPENVPPLSDSEKVDGKQLVDVAEILKAHTSKAICVRCHKQIDPLGLGLEKYDMYGIWRETYKNKRPIQAEGLFPNGEVFNNPKQMKSILLDKYREPIAKNIVERMFAYALGRKLKPYDRPALEQILRAFEKDDYRMNTLIVQIIKSKPFQYRQNHHEK